jgi:small GTP-binding protein
MGGWFSSLTSWFTSKREARILIVGLNCAGKTTILYRLQLNQFVSPVIPTVAFNNQTLEIGNIKLQMWDLGGQDQLRPYWRFYFKETSGVVLVVDSTDRERISICGQELEKLVSAEELAGIPLLVLAHKQDLPDGMTKEEVGQQLGLANIKDRPWQIVATDAINGTGIREAFLWLSETIEKRG